MRLCGTIILDSQNLLQKKSVFHFGVKIQMRLFEHLGTRSILKIVNQSWMML